MNEQRRQSIEEALERIQAAIDRGQLQHVALIQRFGQRRRWERRLEREARRTAKRDEQMIAPAPPAPEAEGPTSLRTREKI